MDGVAWAGVLCGVCVCTPGYIHTWVGCVGVGCVYPWVHTRARVISKLAVVASGAHGWNDDAHRTVRRRGGGRRGG